MRRSPRQRIRVDRGQRIIHEVAFEADPELAARVRFVLPVTHALPTDEHREGPIPTAQPQDVAELFESASVWEALEEDDRRN
jgi:hypothetical protein